MFEGDILGSGALVLHIRRPCKQPTEHLAISMRRGFCMPSSITLCSRVCGTICVCFAESVAVGPSGDLFMLDRYGTVFRAKPGPGAQLERLAFLGPGRPLGFHFDKEGNLIICSAGTVTGLCHLLLQSLDTSDLQDCRVPCQVNAMEMIIQATIFLFLSISECPTVVLLSSQHDNLAMSCRDSKSWTWNP